MSPPAGARSRVLRPLEWSFPPEAVKREVIRRDPEGGTDDGRPPLLFVHGMNHGAWCFDEYWLPAAAAQGWSCHAVSLRGHGASEGHDRRHRWKFRDYEHDVMQAIIDLPRPPVLIGHSMGAQVVRRVLERYAAPAAVLLSPPGGANGWEVMARFARRQPATFLGVLLARPTLLDSSDMFGPEADPATARAYESRMTPEAPLALYELMLRPQPRSARSPVLVAGGGADALIGVNDLVRTARIYGTRPHVFPTMGHELMLEPRWRQVLDLVLEWVQRTVEPA